MFPQGYTPPPTQRLIVPLEEALAEGNNTRISQTDIIQRGIDTRSGNLIARDTQFDRVEVGALADGTYGMKVSKEGYDVKDTANENLIFNSSQNVFKIVQSGTATLNVTSFTTYTELGLLHGLGYAPMVIAYVDYNGDGNVNAVLPYMDIKTSSTNAGSIRRLIDVRTNLLYVIFSCYTPSFAANTLQDDDYTFRIKYYIIQESAN